MIYHTTAKNLKELNASIKQDGIKYIYVGYRQSSAAGYAHQTRHYIAEITKGDNAGATTGQEFEIVFNTPYNEGWHDC